MGTDGLRDLPLCAILDVVDIYILAVAMQIMTKSIT
jgi:hypothetical protein